jgi:ATP-dependent DNA ligase
MATVAYQVGTKSVSRSDRDRPICSPEPCERLPPDTLLDGEIVAIDRDGRVSFNLLPNSRSKAAAIQFYAFDLMMYLRKSLLRVPLHVSLVLLAEALKALVPKARCVFLRRLRHHPKSSFP